MRLVIQERNADDEVIETVIIHLHEPEGGTVTYEEVEDEDSAHWATTFKTWRFNVAALRQIIVTESSHRRQRWYERNIQRAQGEEGV